MLYTSTILPLALTVSLALADNYIPGATFTNDPASVAAAAAPMWYLDSKTCMPQDAIDEDLGTQNKGNAPDNCNELKINHNCPSPPASKGAGTDMNSFPTYWTVRYCAQDDTWRVLYDVYFSKDTGHRFDWEWAIVRMVRDPINDGGWMRDGVWLEQDGAKPYVKWSDLVTFDSTNDLSDKNRGKDHPKLYFGKWHHGVHKDQYGYFANTCPPNAASDYRSDDYKHYAADWLIKPGTLPADWTWGGTSWPHTFEEFQSHDICTYVSI